MPPSAEVISNGRTLEQMLQVSKELLTAQIGGGEVMKSIRDEQPEFSSWMEETHWSGLSDAIASHLCGYLQRNIVSIFAEAWSKFAELRKQVLKTNHDERATTCVGLADHEFTYEIKPCLEIELNGKKVGEIPFTISALFDVTGLELGLHKGCVTYVRTGRCEVSGTLQLVEKTLWHSPSATFDLPGEFHLMNPIRLVSEEMEKVPTRRAQET